MSDATTEVTRDEIQAALVMISEVRDELVEAVKTATQVPAHSTLASIDGRLGDCLTLLRATPPPQTHRLWDATLVMCGIGIGVLLHAAL